MEWIQHPIDCQKMADLAGVRYDTCVVSKANRIRYCRTHYMIDNLPRLRAGGIPCILISSSSDSSVMAEQAEKLPLNVKRWFSTNVMVEDPRIEAIPIGFIFNHVRYLAMKAQAEGPHICKSKLMYVNFTRFAPALHGRRDGLYEMFGDFPWVTTKGGGSHADISAEEFYRDVMAHHFVLSPPGAGPDCHRHWEAMALGAIPIVQRSTATKILDDMPALQVTDWGEVTEARLERAIVELSPRFSSPAMQKLSMKYWADRITTWA